ncbi:hypothetical protein PRSY57_0409400 [Plasmodium reichenowi]|uniref:LITAF domain-containing protein n=1 Tax=Plasmodium reichenowi TaxID=5854 RepID=A0A151LSI1_PLARE|nr:hypothetical protein PRSY57_0409400 [Plasmodium reichenowi]KYO02099.1 hypothetical protein PRSY57_0409400 [Plasmodium reichenowi]
MTGFNGKDQLTEMNVLQNEMKDININDRIHNEDSNVNHNIYNNEMINSNSNNNNSNNNNIYNDHNNSHMYNNIYKNNSYNDGNSTCSGNNNTYNESNFLNDRGEEDEDYYYNNNNNNNINNNYNNNNYNNNYISSSYNYNNKATNEVKEILNCDYCNKHVYPLIKTYTPLFVYIMIIILFVFISFFTIFLLPLLYLTFKQKKYICPYCEKNLTSSEKLFKVKRENQILTFQFPKCAIIISAKYLALFLSLIFLIFFFYIIRITSHFNLDNFVKGPYITSSWIDYLEDCGNKSQFRNKFNSIHNFKKLYYSNTVLWRGSFFQIKEGFLNSNSLYIKMNPSEYKYDRPDIRALFNNNLISQIENLQKNDYIEFECTLIEISKNKSPHLCLLWNVKLIEKYQPKNLSMVDFVKHLSILDMINSHANPNPFFINLNNKDSDIPASIKVLHFSSNGFNEPNIIHTNDPYMLNIMEREHIEPNMKFGHFERKSLPFLDDEEEEEEEEEQEEQEEQEEGDNEDGHPYEFNQYEEPFINDPDDDINIFDDTVYGVPRNVSSFNHNSETFKNDVNPYEYEVSSMYDRDVREEKGPILKDNEHDNKRDSIKDSEHDNKRDNIKDSEHDNKRDSIKDNEHDNKRDSIKDSEHDNKRDSIKDNEHDNKRDSIKDNEHDNKRDNIKDNEHDNKRDNIKDNKHDNNQDNIKDNKHDNNQDNIKDSVPLNEQTGVSNDTPQNLSSDASKSVPKDVQNKVKNEKTQTKQIKKNTQKDNKTTKKMKK